MRLDLRRHLTARSSLRDSPPPTRQARKAPIGRFPQNPVGYRQISHRPPQPRVFTLQLPRLLGLGDPDAATSPYASASTSAPSL